MKSFLLLILFALTLIGCGEGRVDLITDDVVTDVTDCYQILEATESSYIVALDKACVDNVVAGFGPPEIQTWELLVVLERHPIQRYQFYVPDAYIDVITGAFAAGNDFLFVIAGERFIRHEQFYFPATRTAS